MYAWVAAATVAGATAAAATNPLHNASLCGEIVLHDRGDEVLALQVVELLLRPPPLLPAALCSARDHSPADTLVSGRIAVASQHDDWRRRLPAIDNGMRLPSSPTSHQTKRKDLDNEYGEKEAALTFGDVDLVPAPAPEVESESTGADPNGAALGGLRALHIAAVEGRCSVVQALLAASAEVDARLEPTNESAYNLAVAAGHADVADLLKGVGCDTTPVSWAIQQPIEGTTQGAEPFSRTDATVTAQDPQTEVPVGPESFESPRMH